MLFDKDAIKSLIEGEELSPAQTRVDIPNEPVLHISDVDLGSDDRHLTLRMKLNSDLSSLDTHNFILLKHVTEGQELNDVEFYKLDTNKDWNSGEHEAELTQVDLTLDSNTRKLVYESLGNSRPGGIYAIDVEKGFLGFHCLRRC